MSITEAPPAGSSNSSGLRRRHVENPPLGETRTIDRVASVASSMFVMGPDTRKPRPSITRSISQQREAEMKNALSLSRQATLGRNSEFYNLTRQDREKLGGIEYRSLKLLLKIVFRESSIPVVAYGSFENGGSDVCLQLTSLVFISLVWFASLVGSSTPVRSTRLLSKNLART